MTSGKMHDDEVDITPSLVARLITTQFPQWAELPLKPVSSAGTDNALYRLGAELVVRLPCIPGAAGQVSKEQQWLPRLAPSLPLAVPVPLAQGNPGEGYPWSWSVYRWLEGETATLNRLTDPVQAAIDLAQFITALQQIDPAGGSSPGAYNAFRGMPLITRDVAIRTAIASLDGTLDSAAAISVWESALETSAWSGPPVWIHGDLQMGNLLAAQGRLRAVIDFGCLGVGDPAYDVMAAWLYLPAETREIFRATLSIDDATWVRGRGWALSVGLIALPYYQTTNPILVGIARRAIAEALADG